MKKIAFVVVTFGLTGCIDSQGAAATTACNEGLNAFFGSKRDPDYASFEEALKVKPGYPGALAGLALLYSNKGGGQQEGIAYADKAIAGNSKNHSLYFVRAMAKQRAGDQAGAEADLAKAKQLDPKFEGTLADYSALRETRNSICQARNW